MIFYMLLESTKTPVIILLNTGQIERPRVQRLQIRIIIDHNHQYHTQLEDIERDSIYRESGF